MVTISDCPTVVPDEPRREAKAPAAHAEEEEAPPAAGCCACFRSRARRRKPDLVVRPAEPTSGEEAQHDSPTEARKGSILRRRLSADSAKCVDSSEHAVRQSVKESLEAASRYAEEQGHYVPRGDSAYSGEGETAIDRQR